MEPKMDKFDHEIIYPIGPNGELTICISKIGGGTFGKAYEGGWITELYVNHELKFSDETLYTPTPKTHIQAAQIAASVWATDFIGPKSEWLNEFANEEDREYEEL